MPAFIDENQQFIDPDTSAPIVNGDVFFGEQGADPETVPITVYTDRALTIPIAQPVATDASGRTSQKIWIPGRYSFKVENSAGSQKLIDLDAGATEAVGTTVLGDVAGDNDITATADPTITALINGEQFTFTAVARNTDQMTLDIDGVGAKSILFNFAEEMSPGFIQEDQTVNLTYNSTQDAFAWDNEGRAVSLLTDVAGTANVITAVGGPSTVAYIDQQLYSFSPSVSNTGATTLNINDLGAIAIQNKGVAMSASQLLIGILYIVSYDSGSDIFEVVSGLPLSSPGPIGETTPSTIKGTSFEGDGGGATITQFDDDDTLAEDSSTRGVTQAAVKGFVETFAGKLFQIIETDSGTLASGTSLIPNTSIPQISEGTEFLSVTITPKFAASTLFIEVNISGMGTVAGSWVAALFKDGTTSALAGSQNQTASVNVVQVQSFRHQIAAGSTSAQTFTVRCGPSASGTFRINSTSSSTQALGSISQSSIRIMEMG